MEEYKLYNEWTFWVSLNEYEAYRSRKFGPKIPVCKNWFLSYVREKKMCFLDLYREEVLESIQLKGTVRIKSEFKNNVSEKSIDINCVMHAGDIKVPVEMGDVDSLNFHGTINIICLAYVTAIMQRKDKSVQSNAEFSMNSLKSCSKLNEKSFHSLSHEMQIMYDMHEYSDVVLVCNESEFHVHKCILSARSPVFSQIFRMMKTNENRIVIPDIDNIYLEMLLLFMYNGQANPSSYVVARELYMLADKYAVCDLKNICRESILSFLSISTVIETLIFADKHQDCELLKETITFAVSVLGEIKYTEEWVTFLKEYPALGTIVLSSVVEQLCEEINSA